METIRQRFIPDRQCAFALVRPDRYVFGMARYAGELNRMLSSLGRHLLT